MSTIQRNRRGFLRYLATGLGVVGAMPFKRNGMAETSPRRPNILFIMDDQHRGDCVGAAGAKWLRTPHLDRLAKEGVLFRRGYSSMPSCLPARAALLTGKSPWRHGMLVYTALPERYKNEKPRMLAKAGYWTHAVGKMHFNPMRNKHGYHTVELEEGWHSAKKNKLACDYQRWFEATAPERNLNASGLHYTDHRGGRCFPFEDRLHPTHWTAQRAIDFLDHYRGEAPWFLKVSFQRPHPPFDPPKRWYDQYESVPFPMPQVGAWAQRKYGEKKGSLEKTSQATSGAFPKSEIEESRRSYYAAISYVDEQIGRVIDALEQRGEWENTLILFTSDHGDMMGDQHMWRKCRPYEPSARVPMILRWPESLGVNAERGQIRDELVELRDVLPSFLDAAGIDKPRDMDGMSLLDIMRGKPWRDLLDLEHGKIYEPDNAWVALTDARYKYIYFTLTGEQQLFDLRSDPHELKNLAEESKYHSLIQNWREKMIEHLSVRGKPWIQDGDLAVQKKQIRFSPNEPRYVDRDTAIAFCS